MEIHRLPAIAALLLLTALPARADTVGISRETCAELVQHVPGSDVEYRPGVDVNGDKVAPADMPENAQITVPREFSIPITVDLGKRLGIPRNPNSFQSNAEIGVLSYKDGQLFFNGQPLQNPDEAALSQACQRLMQGK